MLIMENKQIAVIGGGYAGICTMSMLREEGLEPICFEKTDKVGGTWCYREDCTPSVPSIMPSTIINHSKEMGAMSNFPPDKKYNNYMRHYELYEYIMEYANKNDVLKSIQCNMEVISVKRAEDYEDTGRFDVTVKNTITGKVTSDTYAGVVVCVGALNIPKFPPSYKYQETFKGKIIHTHSLKSIVPYENKKVVVVGMGCSGLDAAVEVSNVTKQVYLSTRSGAHVLSRTGPYGYPIDATIIRRFITIFLSVIPFALSWIIENLIINPRFSSRLYRVQPKWHFLSKDPVVNDHLYSKLLSGSIIQTNDIARFTENGVIFDGESSVTEADVIIMATGYALDIPFLEKDIFIGKQGTITLYKNIWPPYLKHSTLAFVGFLLPCGPGFPCGELQCRCVAYMMKGKGKLPSTKEMLEDIKKRIESNAVRYINNNRLSIRVDVNQYCDELAKIIGAKPNFFKMFFTDPKLFFKLVFGPSVPYQYRLQGPHSWSGAREAIMTCEERIRWPLKQTHEHKEDSFLLKFLKKLFSSFFPFL